jgi:hypothetical protein
MALTSGSGPGIDGRTGKRGIDGKGGALKVDGGAPLVEIVARGNAVAAPAEASAAGSEPAAAGQAGSPLEAAAPTSMALMAGSGPSIDEERHGIDEERGQGVAGGAPLGESVTHGIA